MYYLVIHFVGKNGQEIFVYNRDGNRQRAEFSTLADAEIGRAIAIKYNSHSALINITIESD